MLRPNSDGGSFYGKLFCLLFHRKKSRMPLNHVKTRLKGAVMFVNPNQVDVSCQ